MRSCGPVRRPTRKLQVEAGAVVGSWALHGREGGGGGRGRGGALDGAIDPVVRALQALGQHCTESCLPAQ